MAACAFSGGMWSAPGTTGWCWCAIPNWPTTTSTPSSATKVKNSTEDGFVQTRIRLESLNPAFPSWDLDAEEDKYQIIAEFVRVLE